MTAISLVPPERNALPRQGATNTRKRPRHKRSGPDATRSLFCLAPHGVYPAPPVARRAVGSYPAFSPLPRHSRTAYADPSPEAVYFL